VVVGGTGDGAGVAVFAAADAGRVCPPTVPVAVSSARATPLSRVRRVVEDIGDDQAQNASAASWSEGGLLESADAAVLQGHLLGLEDVELLVSALRRHAMLGDDLVWRHGR
jgi:hypothetical protein